MTDLESLQIIRTSIIAKLADLTANPRPDYAIDGQSVSWGSLQSSLFEQLAQIDELIRRENSANVPPTSVPYANAWRDTYGRSPYVGGDR